MKKIYSAVILFLLFFNSFAQVANDDCQTATDIGIMDATLSYSSPNGQLFDTCILVSNTNATPSFPYLLTDSTCFNYSTNSASRDVWYKFISYGTFTIFGMQVSGINLDSPSITIWEASACSQMRAVGNFSYVFSSANGYYFYDTVWVNGSNIFDTLYAQISGIQITDTGDFYLCLSALGANVTPAAGCYFVNANTDTICFTYNIDKTDAITGTGTAHIHMQGGNAPFTFLWNDGNTDSIRTNLAGGKYFVTITDAGGCSETDSIAIFSKCNLTLQSTHNGLGNYSIGAYGNNNTTPKHYIWSLNGQFLMAALNAPNNAIGISFDTNGVYTICVYMADTSSLCVSDTCFQITVTNTSYVHLLDSINIWHYTGNLMPVLTEPGHHSRSTSCGPSSTWGFGAYTEFTGNDTSIGNKSYKILQSLNYNTWPHADCTMGFIREDTITGKIYFLDTDSLNEILLYNFGMNVGETISISLSNGGGLQSGTYRLDSIISFASEHTASPRREFYLNNPSNPQQAPLKWVEGIGHMIEFAYTFLDFFSQNWGGLFGCPEYQNPSGHQVLICYEHKNLDFYDACALSQAIGNWCFNYQDTCNYYNICGGIEEVSSLASFSISPNPADVNAILELDVKQSDRFSIIVQSLDGKTVIPENDLGWLPTGTFNKPLSLAKLSTGIYLVGCKTKEGTIHKKLVVQR